MSKDTEREGVGDKDRNPKPRRTKNAAGDSSGCQEIEFDRHFRGSCRRDGDSNASPMRTSTSRTNGAADAFNGDHQGAAFSYVPSLSDEVALLILARVPRSEYQKLRFVSRRYQSLVKSGELYAVRREVGIKEPSVLLLASGEPHWSSYDPRSGARRNLPTLPSDPCFSLFDKESLCVGTHLLVSGKEIGGSAVWRYELASDNWFKGPLMINPRCLFASANCGSVACVAGGIGAGSGLEVLNSAEKYDPESRTWRPLPTMNRRRKLCAGCYMDGKFYVIGGQDEKGDNLTCAEFYDPDGDAWVLIPDMIEDAPSWSSRSPPLVAVVNNELYSLDAASNEVKVYLKRSNSWKVLGAAPVRADHSRGWGVAFKSLGDELLIIGSTAGTYTCQGMTICTCRPGPGLDPLQWRILERDGDQWSSFIFNCSVMLA